MWCPFLSPKQSAFIALSPLLLTKKQLAKALWRRLMRGLSFFFRLAFRILRLTEGEIRFQEESLKGSVWQPN